MYSRSALLFLAVYASTGGVSLASDGLHPEVASLQTEFELADNMTQMVLNAGHDCKKLISEPFPANRAVGSENITRTTFACDFFAQQLGGVVNGTAVFSFIGLNTRAQEQIHQWRNASKSAEDKRKANQADEIVRKYMRRNTDMTSECVSILGKYKKWKEKSADYGG